ncbi:MAG: prepilin peptidase [Planctomycetes bacterium]|nr:prepilin peptidase [Planctomycetota bacterium]
MGPLAKEFGLAIEVTLFLLLIVSAYTDITAGKVYNLCTFPAFFLGLAFNYLLGGFSSTTSEACLVNSLLGAALGGGLFGLVYLFGGVAGGDVKMVLAIGALKGLKFTFLAIFYTSVIGAILASGLVIWQGRFWATFAGGLRLLFTFRRPQSAADREKTEAARQTLPYGVAVSIGTMWAWWLDMAARRAQNFH